MAAEHDLTHARTPPPRVPRSGPWPCGGREVPVMVVSRHGLGKGRPNTDKVATGRIPRYNKDVWTQMHTWKEQ